MGTAVLQIQYFASQEKCLVSALFEVDNGIALQVFFFMGCIYRGVVYEKNKLKRTSEGFFAAAFHPRHGTLPACVLAEKDTYVEGGKPSPVLERIKAYRRCKAGLVFAKYTLLCGGAGIFVLLDGLLDEEQKLHQVFKMLMLRKSVMEETAAKSPVFIVIHADDERAAAFLHKRFACIGHSDTSISCNIFIISCHRYTAVTKLKSSCKNLPKEKQNELQLIRTLF
jgi:hypothetical protein